MDELHSIVEYDHMKRKRSVGSKINRQKTPDYLLAGLVLGLTLFGVLMVYNTSVIVAHEEFGDKFWFLKNQGLWAIVGITGGYIVSNIDYHYWKRWARIFYYISIILLVLVILPGFSSEVYGAKSRLSFPLGLPFLEHLSIQPSELAKFTTVLYLAYYFSENIQQKTKAKTEQKLLQTVVPFLSIIGLVIGLIMLQPDLGTALILGASSMLVYFLSGAPLVDILVVTAIGSVGALGFAFSSSYRRDRILAFLNPASDTQGISYHINQILIALGSGGLLGFGLGHSRQKYQYLPEVTTDSIFAVIGEELGFIGASLVIIAFIILIWRGMDIVERCEDQFGKLLAAGILSIILIQTIVNLTSMVAFAPLTGVPLPFISYGGSSLTMLLVGIGILLNISKEVPRA